MPKHYPQIENEDFPMCPFCNEITNLEYESVDYDHLDIGTVKCCQCDNIFQFTSYTKKIFTSIADCESNNQEHIFEDVYMYGEYKYSKCIVCEQTEFLEEKKNDN